MSLIKCSKCGKEISDKAKKCPNCGWVAGVSVKENKQANILRAEDKDLCLIEKQKYKIEGDSRFKGLQFKHFYFLVFLMLFLMLISIFVSAVVTSNIVKSHLKTDDSMMTYNVSDTEDEMTTHIENTEDNSTEIDMVSDTINNTSNDNIAEVEAVDVKIESANKENIEVSCGGVNKSTVFTYLYITVKNNSDQSVNIELGTQYINDVNVLRYDSHYNKEIPSGKANQIEIVFDNAELDSVAFGEIDDIDIILYCNDSEKNNPIEFSLENLDIIY